MYPPNKSQNPSMCLNAANSANITASGMQLGAIGVFPSHQMQAEMGLHAAAAMMQHHSMVHSMGYANLMGPQGVPMDTQDYDSFGAALHHMTPEEAAAVGTAMASKGDDTANKANVHLRKAAGLVWNDSTLDDWPEDDFRVFVGDLGNEVTDELLAQAFRKYKTFQKSRVIRDKKTGKTKGYGFVSFGSPEDLLKATNEMNRKYVGNRPIRVLKSKWKERDVDSEKNQSMNEVLHTAANNSRTLKKFKKFKPVTGPKQKGWSASTPRRPMPYRGPHGLRPNAQGLNSQLAIASRNIRMSHMRA